MSIQLDVRISSGQNLRNSLRIARELGCKIEPIRATGEGRLRHSLMEKTVRFSRVRKDSPQEVTQFLRSVAERLTVRTQSHPPIPRTLRVGGFRLTPLRKVARDELRR